MGPIGKKLYSKLTAVKRPYFQMAKNGKIRDFWQIV